MRRFTELQEEIQLDEFLDPPEGTLYIGEIRPGQDVVVRYFDGSLPADKVGAFASIVSAAREWLEEDEGLAALVRVEALREVGEDFIVRNHHVYCTSTRSYFDDEDPPEPPRQLAEMRALFRAATEQVDSQREQLIANVLERSIVRPSGKTFFEDEEDRFIIVEPSITVDDLERWDAVHLSQTDR